jgi:hypothetical protein
MKTAAARLARAAPQPGGVPAIAGDFFVSTLIPANKQCT